MRACFALLSLLLLASSAAAADGLVEPREVRKVVADGKHNAFTALAHFKDRYWLAFRSAKEHNTLDGDIIVMTSKDGKEWTEAFRHNVLPDDRDPQFLNTGKRLILYNNAMKGVDMTAYATYTDDGEKWSKPQTVYEPRFILWKPCKHGDKFYATAHKKDETGDGKGRAVHMIVSDDGLAWKKVSTIREGNWESETTLHFGPGDKATAFLRQKYGSPDAQMYTSEPPYEKWTLSKEKVPHFSGHSACTFKGVSYLLSRTKDGKKMGTMIYTFADGKLKPYCALPSGGDCSYAEAVEMGDNMLVSFYSTHEGTTNIYVAVVPLAK